MAYCISMEYGIPIWTTAVCANRAKGGRDAPKANSIPGRAPGGRAPKDPRGATRGRADRPAAAAGGLLVLAFRASQGKTDTELPNRYLWTTYVATTSEAALF